MKKTDGMENTQFIFGAVMVVGNRMDTLLERELSKFNITSKQWFLSVSVASLFEYPPTMKEAAREMGTSYQNVKQLALKLQDKKLLQLKKDVKDARITRLHLTKESEAFWLKTSSEGMKFTQDLFAGITAEELALTRNTLAKMMDNMSEMEKKQGKGENS